MQENGQPFGRTVLPRYPEFLAMRNHAPTNRLSSSDVQAQIPSIRASLSRVGVTGVERIIQLETENGAQLYSITLDCFVDLSPKQKGVHMSRFPEVFNEAIEATISSPTRFVQAETLAANIAETIRQRQHALRSEVQLEMRYPEHKTTPESGILTQEIYTLYGAAVATEVGIRSTIGVKAHGMTVCPCAQDLVRTRALKRLTDDGFTDDEIKRIFAAVPVASHNQRGIGTLHIGLPSNSTVAISAPDLLAIVEQSMSTEIYELMKRSDEAVIVERAHQKPRFVEDCVREMIAATLNRFPDLPDSAFISAHQENIESIHKHNVTAERFGLVGEVRAELSLGVRSEQRVSMAQWLG